MKVYLVWNEAKSECVGFTDKVDAQWTFKGKWPKGYSSLGVPSIGETFRDYYADEDQTLHMEEVEAITAPTEEKAL